MAMQRSFISMKAFYVLSIIVALSAQTTTASPLTLTRQARRPGVTGSPALKGFLASVLPQPKVVPSLFCLPLRREMIPIRHKGRIVTYKTSYSGVVQMGTPSKDFRVVFDTGSGHIVLPSVECGRSPCLEKMRYNMSASTTGDPMDLSGQVSKPHDPRDQVTIGYGTGQVRGEFVRDSICVDPGKNEAPLCVKAHIVAATELSQNPFGIFPFDGILGMGLKDLALNQNFSFMDVLYRSGQLIHPQFSVFLTEPDEGEESEIAFGGYNPDRLSDPEFGLQWAPVAMADHGHWQVEILALHIGDVTLDVCHQGDCRGAIDTGTSHLGIPAPYDKTAAALLVQPSGDLSDCRLVEAPEVKVELRGFNLTLTAGSYMRRLPIREDVKVGSSANVGTTDLSNSVPSDQHQQVNATVLEVEPEVASYCRAKLMPVRMPAPFGPNMFILGEPLLQRYYTVFDVKTRMIGFGLSSSKLLNRLAAEKHTRRYVYL